MNNELSNKLSNYQKNIFSQFGEDGILEEVLKRLNKEIKLDKWCVEFGAWDGIYLSNTFNLIKNHSYQAVLIEGDSEKHKELCSNIPDNKIIKICQFVTFDGDSTLDKILEKTKIPNDFDFLSIDIDGCDYYILDSLVRYKPKIICIEYNPTVQNEVIYIQEKDFSIKRGSGALAVKNLANKKGYSLVATTECNLIFVRSEFKELVIGLEDNSLDLIRNDSRYKTYIFSGYDGTVLSNKEFFEIPWHKIKIETIFLQQIPSCLRRFRADYGQMRKILFNSFMLCKHPRVVINYIKKLF